MPGDESFFGLASCSACQIDFGFYNTCRKTAGIGPVPIFPAAGFDWYKTSTASNGIVTGASFDVTAATPCLEWPGAWTTVGTAQNEISRKCEYVYPAFLIK